MTPPLDGPTGVLAAARQPPLGPTRTGLSPRVAAALAYAAWWVSGGLFLALEPENAFVRFHARQALVVFGIVWLVGVACWALTFVGVFLSPALFRAASALSQFTWAAGVLLWIVCVLQAARGRSWAVPGLPGRYRPQRPLSGASARR